MQGQHEARQTARKKQNGQQQDDTHFIVTVTQDHQSHQQNVHRNADRRQQIFRHKDITKGPVR